MSENFKPGDIAIVTVENYASSEQMVALCHHGGVDDRGTGDGTARWYLADGTEVWSSVSAARRLVVIDPEDREQVERLEFLYIDASGSGNIGDALQAALREFANPTPPKPEEPTGLGAVVEDIHGRRYQRIDRDRHCWLRSDIAIDAAIDWRDYDEITVVRVLSEGVTP